MGKTTEIAWCDSTFNPWIGCTKVSPACANCYAETLMDTRYHKVKWGKGQPRQRTSAANWKQPLKWEKEAEKTGIRRKVFCGSLCDWLDAEVPIEWLADLLDLIRRTPHLDWLLLTKMPELWHERIGWVRDWLLISLEDETTLNSPFGFAARWKDKYPEEVARLIAMSLDERKARLTKWASALDLACSWTLGDVESSIVDGKLCDVYEPPANVWIGCTVENQEMADKRIPELLKIPARVRFLSCEPLLGPVNLRSVAYIRAGGQTIIDTLTGHMPNAFSGTKPIWARIDWIICGGESGPKARPMHPDWARGLRDQCKAAGVPFFFKQWGEWAHTSQARYDQTIQTAYEEISDAQIAGSLADGKFIRGTDSYGWMHVGKARAGHLLDGVEHHEFPRVESEASHE